MVMTHTRGPDGSGCLESISEHVKRSPTLSTRVTPTLLNAASYTSSRPANDPVWDATASALRACFPALITRSGLVRANARAALMKLAAWVTDSMYMMMLRVCGSEPK